MTSYVKVCVLHFQHRSLSVYCIHGKDVCALAPSSVNPAYSRHHWPVLRGLVEATDLHFSYKPDEALFRMAAELEIHIFIG